jgi:hypothetical protein
MRSGREFWRLVLEGAKLSRGGAGRDGSVSLWLTERVTAYRRHGLQHHAAEVQLLLREQAVEDGRPRGAATHPPMAATLTALQQACFCGGTTRLRRGCILASGRLGNGWKNCRGLLPRRGTSLDRGEYDMADVVNRALYQDERKGKEQVTASRLHLTLTKHQRRYLRYS